MRHADTLEKAEVSLKTQRTDLVLLDNNLRPGQTAQDTVPTLKAITAVPLIVISSHLTASYLQDKSILKVHDIIDKFHLPNRIASGLCEVKQAT